MRQGRFRGSPPVSAPRRFDHTALSDLGRCEEYFARRHRDGLDRPEPSAAQACGTAIHAGVRAYYAGHNDGLVAEATLKGYGAALPGTDYRTPTLAVDYVAAYMRAYPKPWPFAILWNEGYIEGEDFTGIPDRCVRRTLDGLCYPFDLKTTSGWLGTAWQEQWAYSQQAAMQMTLLEHRLKLPMAGFWMDAVYLSSRKAGPQASDFVRCGPFTYTPAVRAELLAQVVYDSVRANEIVAGTGAPPRPTGVRTGGCTAYNKLCAFHRFCRLDPSDRADAYNVARATGELVERRWEPASRG